MSSNRLKALRLELGYSQGQLAQATHVSRTTICGWEQGHQNPPGWFWLAAEAVRHGLRPYEAPPELERLASKIRRIDARTSPISVFQDRGEGAVGLQEDSLGGG